MSETALPDPDAAPRRSRKSSWIRLTIEFVLLFAIAVALKQFVITPASSYPNPLWLPVVVLSLEYGLATGLAAALIATGLQYSGGLPQAYLTEDMYSFIGRISAEPVSWICVALLIGHFRSRQIAHVAELEAELAERGEHATAVANLCVDLRSRTEILERHIAANASASNVDVAEAIRELHDATWDNFAERLTHFVALMTGAAEFSVLLLRDNALKVVFQPNDQHTAAGDVVISPDEPIFAAVVNERRTLSASRPDEQGVLASRAAFAGPLLDVNAPARVIGMFMIGGAALDDHPEDIDRRFSLVTTEISRLLGRILLIESWHAAAAPGQSNGHPHEEQPAGAEARAQNGGARVVTSGNAGPDREITLQ